LRPKQKPKQTGVRSGSQILNVNDSPETPSFMDTRWNRLKNGEVGIMRFRRFFVVVLVLVGAASAQTLEDGLRSEIKAVHYAPLAEQARIQGDVHLNVKSGVVTLLSGHPLLATIAVESAKAFGPIKRKTDFDMIYHFVLVDTATSVPTSITVPRGNVFERAVLRVLGLKTEKAVLDYRCQEGAPPENDVKIAAAVIEIWIFGKTRCLQPEAATFVAKR
jgi:hypothetical protein